MANIQSIVDVLSSDKHAPRNRKAYGISGWSDEVSDATAINNIPVHPKEGKPMSPRWVKRNEIGLWQSRGYSLIPVECFREGFRGKDGQRPLWCDSPSAKPDETLGVMTRAGGTRVAMWCEPSTKQAEEDMIAQRNMRAKLGNLVDKDGAMQNGKRQMAGGGVSVSVAQVDKSGMGDSRSPFDMPDEMFSEAV